MGELLSIGHTSLNLVVEDVREWIANDESQHGAKRLKNN